MSTIAGIHHVTAIASDPQPNLDFYVRFLGLRLVKRTVNFDDPETYHFYYGDETGSPGTIMTFFPWPGARRGRPGASLVTTTSFAVPAGSIPFWQERSTRYGVEVLGDGERFGHRSLHLRDGDGLDVELVDSGSKSATSSPEIPDETAVRGIGSVTLSVNDAGPTRELLTGMMGFRETGQEDGFTRFESAGGGPGASVDLYADAGLPRAMGGAGTVHHVAFRTSNDEEQLRWRGMLMKEGYGVSPVMDRNYFHSIYFREPNGILFEIATDPPGFTVDETIDELGSALKLPEMYEGRRSQIERVLPPITVPTTGLVTESY